MYFSTHAAPEMFHCVTINKGVSKCRRGQESWCEPTGYNTDVPQLQLAKIKKEDVSVQGESSALWNFPWAPENMIKCKQTFPGTPEKMGTRCIGFPRKLVFLRCAACWWKSWICTALLILGMVILKARPSFLETPKKGASKKGNREQLWFCFVA